MTSALLAAAITPHNTVNRVYRSEWETALSQFKGRCRHNSHIQVVNQTVHDYVIITLE